MRYWILLLFIAPTAYAEYCNPPIGVNPDGSFTQLGNTPDWQAACQYGATLSPPTSKAIAAQGDDYANTPPDPNNCAGGADGYCNGRDFKANDARILSKDGADAASAASGLMYMKASSWSASCFLGKNPTLCQASKDLQEMAGYEAAQATADGGAETQNQAQYQYLKLQPVTGTPIAYNPSTATMGPPPTSPSSSSGTLTMQESPSAAVETNGAANALGISPDDASSGGIRAEASQIAAQAAADILKGTSGFVSGSDLAGGDTSTADNGGSAEPASSDDASPSAPPPPASNGSIEVPWGSLRNIQQSGRKPVLVASAAAGANGNHFFSGQSEATASVVKSRAATKVDKENWQKTMPAGLGRMYLQTAAGAAKKALLMELLTRKNLQSVGLLVQHRGENIFQTSHRHFRRFGKYRKAPQIAQADREW